MSDHALSRAKGESCASREPKAVLIRGFILSVKDITSDHTARYWLDKLDDAPSALELPADRSRPMMLAREVRSAFSHLPMSSAVETEALAHSCGTSLYAIILSLWQALLYRHSEQRDLIIGCSGMERVAQDSNRWAIIRSNIDGNGSFRQLLKRTAYELQEGIGAAVSMTELLEALRIEPNANRHPVFQVAFVQCHEPLTELPPRVSDQLAPCDISLLWHASASGIELRLDYSHQLFDTARVRRLLCHMKVLLDAALVAPNTALDDLPLLTKDEQGLIRTWNTTAQPFDTEQTIAAMFATQVERTPQAIAVEFLGETLTYRELDNRANQLAQELVSRGIGPDNTVGISIERSVGMVVAVLATLKAGGAYVPIDPAYPAARREYMIEHSRARVLLTDQDHTAVAPGVEVIDMRQAATPQEEAHHVPAGAVTGKNLGYVIFTSGSTGQPKPVALPQRALTNLIEWQLRRTDFAPGTRTLQFASLSFDVSFQEIFTTWCSGGTLVMIQDAVRRDPRSFLEYIRTHRIGRVFLPFVALRGLADAALAAELPPLSLREVYTAGEQLVVDDTIRAFFTNLPSCLLENQYGPSESHVVTAYRLEGSPETWPTLPPIGAPIANSTVHVLDHKGRPRPIGVPGELFLGGICLAREYLERPDLTAERFVERSEVAPGERLYKTGDLARWLEDGSLEFLGRIDHQVKFRGYRIELGEVASVLSGFSGVRQCVASIVQLENVGQRLAAYAVPKDGAALSLHELHQFAKDNLPDYMVPSHYVIVDAFPLTPSGKIDIANLPLPSFDRRILATEYEEPSTESEHRLTEIWQKLLGVPKIGRHDDFFDLGGDSLMAVEMFLLIAEQFERDLPLGALAQAPTIAGLAALLDETTQEQSWQILVPLKTSGDKLPLFCIHGGSGNIASFPKLARALPPDQPVYGLQWDGLNGHGGARTIEAMAERYLEEIRSVQPRGPYLLAGQCIGGLIAREIARQLVSAGEDVVLLVMYEAPNMNSGHFRLHRRLPAFSSSLSPLMLRSAGAAIMGLKVLTGKYPRDQVLRIRARDLAGLQVLQKDRTLHGSLTMIRAAWKHHIKPLSVRTLYFHNGSDSARSMALVGHWSDGVKGWSDHLSQDFESHRVEAEHNDIPFAPAAVLLLVKELERIHQARANLSSNAEEVMVLRNAPEAREKAAS